MDFGKPLFGSVNKPKRCAKLLLCSESASHPCLDGSDNRILVIGQHTRGSPRTILCNSFASSWIKDIASHAPMFDTVS